MLVECCLYWERPEAKYHFCMTIYIFLSLGVSTLAMVICNPKDESTVRRSGLFTDIIFKAMMS